MLDDVRPLVGGVRVDPERPDPERSADRPPVDVRVGDRDLLQLLDPSYLVRAQLALLSSKHHRVDGIVAVDALFEVRSARPVRERRVAQTGEQAADFRLQLSVERQPLVARRLAEEQLVRLVQPLQLLDRTLVVVHPKIDERVREPA